MRVGGELHAIIQAAIESMHVKATQVLLQRTARSAYLSGSTSTSPTIGSAACRRVHVRLGERSALSTDPRYVRTLHFAHVYAASPSITVHERVLDE